MNEMTDRHASDDVLDTLARYAPTPTSVSLEWSTARSNDALAGIIDGSDDVGDVRARGPVHMLPDLVPARSGARRHGWPRGLSVAASVAVLAVAAGAVVVAVLTSRGSGSAGPAAGLGLPFDPPAGLSDTTLRTGQYSYRVDQQIDLDAHGKPKPHGQDAMVDRNWMSPNGDTVSFRTGSQNGCFIFPHSGTASFEEPTRSFFDSLPTDVDALNIYLRNHVEGSSSRDEAVFVAVGDALSTADGLATERLRGALVGVLSRTPGVLVHEDQRDYLGRRALRADFVDQRIRPGEVQSLYFDPATFQLLEQRSGTNGQPSTDTGPSPAYNDAPGPADDPDELTGAAFIDVMTSETVVDKLPAIPSNCTR